MICRLIDPRISSRKDLEGSQGVSFNNITGSAMSKDNERLPSMLINIVCELDFISQLDRPKQRNNIQAVDAVSELTNWGS
ncbi:UNVERIFIED_CONTAM: hypothetical protein FKN15_011162 [Acipenser sinensis]